jgi:hypothetical protein
VYFLDGVYSEVLSISGIAATGFTAKKEEMAKKKR